MEKGGSTSLWCWGAFWQRILCKERRTQTYSCGSFNAPYSGRIIVSTGHQLYLSLLSQPGSSEIKTKYNKTKNNKNEKRWSKILSEEAPSGERKLQVRWKEPFSFTGSTGWGALESIHRSVVPRVGRGILLCLAENAGRSCTSGELMHPRHSNIFLAEWNSFRTTWCWHSIVSTSRSGKWCE